MITSSTYKVDLLNSDNYIVWQRHLKWILDDQELWGVINGSELILILADPRAITPAEQMAIEDWKRKNKKANVKY